MYMEQVLLLSI